MRRSRRKRWGRAIVEERGAAMTIERHCGWEKAP